MKRKLTIGIGLISTILLLNACSWQVEAGQGNNNITINGNNVSINGKNTVKGNGNVVKSEITIEDYSLINIEGCFDVHYSVAENPFLEITTDENLLEHIDVYVKNNTLHIKLKKKSSINPSKMEIRSSSSTLSAIKIAGSSDVKIESDLNTENFSINVAGSGDVENKGILRTTDLKINISGSGDISLRGEATNADVHISGSGDVDIYNCIAENVDCTISGSSDVKLSVTERLTYKISGSGDIIYKGEPSTVEGKVSGTGSIKKR